MVTWHGAVSLTRAEHGVPEVKTDGLESDIN